MTDPSPRWAPRFWASVAGGVMAIGLGTACGREGSNAPAEQIGIGAAMADVSTFMVDVRQTVR